MFIIIIGAIVISIVIAIVMYFVMRDSGSQVEMSELEGIANNKKKMTPKEFFDFKEGKTDFPGIFIIHNHTDGSHYVGNSPKVLAAIEDQLTGNGNERIKDAFRCGCKISIYYLTLNETGYNSSEELAKDYIRSYNNKRNNHGIDLNDSRNRNRIPDNYVKRL